MKKSNPKVVYLTQVPGPYRERMHELIAEQNPNYSVLYCATLEPDRLWKIDYGKYPMRFLTDKIDHFRPNQPKVWKVLNELNADVLIITAFKPTMLYGVMWCMMKRKKLIVYNDGTLLSERNFSKIQKLIRRFVFKVTDAFVACGKGGFDLYKSYGVKESKMFKSCLCIDNSRFTSPPIEDREYHLMFCGKIVDSKLPMLFVEVAKILNKEIPNFKVLLVGEGDKRKEVLAELEKNNIAYYFAGFLDQNTLPLFYAKAKLLLFPTIADCWGIVANEACAAGTPVITCEYAGVANDLVIHGKNGYVLTLNAQHWAKHALHLLKSPELLKTFSENAVKLVQPFNHQQSANGILESVAFSLS